MISGREDMLLWASKQVSRIDPAVHLFAHLLNNSTPNPRLLGCPAKMTICSELAEYEWLTGSEAGAVLEELAADTSALHTAVSRLRGRFTPRQTHLLIEQAELRRRAVTKFAQAERMFFMRVGLEQATDEWVARYKALRFRRN